MLKPKSTPNVLGPSRVQTRPFYYENQSNKQSSRVQTQPFHYENQSIKQTKQGTLNPFIILLLLNPNRSPYLSDQQLRALKSVRGGVRIERQ